jgi:hypothetical protein
MAHTPWLVQPEVIAKLVKVTRCFFYFFPS